MRRGGGLNMNSTNDRLKSGEDAGLIFMLGFWWTRPLRDGEVLV